MQLQILNSAIAANNPPVAAKATATITTVAVANILEGENFAIQDADGQSCVFVFTKTAGVYVDRGFGGPRHPVSLVGAVTADDVRDRIITAVNECAHVQITATSGGAATVTLTQDRFAAPLQANTATVENVVNAGFVITAFSGGTLSGTDIRRLRGSRDDHTPADKMSLILRSTAGSGVMTVSAKMWGFNLGVGMWTPLGPAATDANRGAINGAVAIGELAAPADLLEFSDLIDGLFAMDYAYLEITAIGGTATAVSAWLVSP